MSAPAVTRFEEPRRKKVIARARFTESRPFYYVSPT